VRVQADQKKRFKETEKYEQHPNAGEATFLVGRHAGGFCLVDQVMDWDWDTMGQISEQYDTRLQSVNGRPEILIQIQRDSRMELDQEELESGEDDLRYARCASRRYVRDGARFTLTKSEEIGELCSPLPKRK
jgi:hypothetical protein